MSSTPQHRHPTPAPDVLPGSRPSGPGRQIPAAAPARSRRTNSTNPADPHHGAYAGARAHERAGERPCTACRDAAAAYRAAARKKNPETYHRGLQAQLHRDHALRILRTRHQDEYDTILAALTATQL